MSQSAEVTRLVALIDRLEALLERSGLSELEVEAGGTSVILRTPAAFATVAAAVSVEEGPSERAAAGGTGAAARARMPSWRR